MGFFLVSEGIELEVKQNLQKTVVYADIRGGVEDTRLEAKTKDTKKSEAKAKTALSRTDPLEAQDRNARGQGPRTQAQVF